MNTYKKGETKETYTHRNGREQALPIYYRNKAYTDKERELLWIEKLDKEKRYVLGQEIDISKSMKGYYRALEAARKKNDKLGYGNNRRSWKREEYEKQMRAIKQTERGLEIEKGIEEVKKIFTDLTRAKPETITGEEIIMNYRPEEDWSIRKKNKDRRTGWDDI